MPFALVAAAPVASASPALPTPPPTASGSVDFNYIPLCTTTSAGTECLKSSADQIQYWTIPAGVTDLMVVTVGADGASGQAGGLGDGGGGGGDGLEVTTPLHVGAGYNFAPGDTLAIYVGGEGGHSQLPAFQGGSGGSGSCVIGFCGGAGGPGGGGSAVEDMNGSQWIAIAPGGGGGGGGDDSFDFTNGTDGGASSGAGATKCIPLDPSGSNAGKAGDKAADGSGSGGGGGGGGGCPGAGGGKSGSDITTTSVSPGAGGSGGYYYGYLDPATSGISVQNDALGDGWVGIEYGYTPATLTTTPSATSVGIGTTMKDTATLSGLSDQPTLNGLQPPSGSITFTLLDGSTVVDTEPVQVTGNGSYTTPTGYLPTAAGTYHWDVTYSGDGFNEELTDVDDPAEVVTVSDAQPTLSAAPSQSTVQLGDGSTTLQATATLSGGYKPSGVLGFALYSVVAGSASSSPLETEFPVIVTGDGTYDTPNGYKLPSSGTVTGTYEWVAGYYGDTNNNEARSTEGDPGSVVTVTAASPTLSTEPSFTTVAYGPGTVLTDTATLSGGYYPGGTITFTLDYNGTTVDTEPAVTVNGNGSYTTPNGYTLPTSAATGSYQWNATYSGDGNNNPVSDINNSTEQVSVSPGSATSSTTLNPPATVTYGSESAGTLSGFVTGVPTEGAPEGTVQINDSTGSLCNATLIPDSADSSKFSCSPTDDFALPAGPSFVVQAFYEPATASSTNPNYLYGGSQYTSAIAVDQAQLQPVTTLSVSNPSISYGSEGSETFSGSVIGVTGYGRPQGVVVVKSGSTTLCSYPLASGAPAVANYTCGLSATQLGTGSYNNVQAFYQPAGASSSDPSVVYAAVSSSPPGSFAVTPAVESTSTTLNVSAQSVIYGSEGSETLSGTVSGQAGDGTPQGSVSITSGSLTICTYQLTPAGTYTCTLGAAQLNAGNYASVQATYQPAAASSSNPDYAYTGSIGSGSFTVNRATPVINWANPASIVFGTLLSSTQLNASASVPGLLAYSPAAGTLLPPGSGQVLHVTFTPSDSTNYTTATATASINVTSQACSSSTSSGGLTVSAGQAGCLKAGATVNGAVTVNPHGALYMSGGTIKGNLTVTGATAVWLCNVTITGGVTITGTTGPVLVGGTGCKNLIANSVSITGNNGGVTYLGNTVKGSLTITGNKGTINYIASQNSTTEKVTISNP